LGSSVSKETVLRHTKKEAAMHRHPWIFGLILTCALLAMGSGLSSAEVSTFTYEVPEPELRSSGEHVYFGIEGFGSSTTPYYPVLPTK
jgi:hypothetical protein